MHTAASQIEPSWQYGFYGGLDVEQQLQLPAHRQGPDNLACTSWCNSSCAEVTSRGHRVEGSETAFGAKLFFHDDCMRWQSLSSDATRLRPLSTPLAPRRHLECFTQPPTVAGSSGSSTGIFKRAVEYYLLDDSDSADDFAQPLNRIGFAFGPSSDCAQASSKHVAPGTQYHNGTGVRNPFRIVNAFAGRLGQRLVVLFKPRCAGLLPFLFDV